jgi:hypothetical protein
MADEKKPKIDLKARLGKAAPPAPTPAPAAAAPAAAPGAPPRSNAPPPMAAAGGIPTPAPISTSPRALPGGVPVPKFGSGAPPALDPSNPLAAAAGYRKPVAAAARPPEPQVIEVDEMTIRQATKSARRLGVIIGGFFGILLAGVTYVAGGAQEQSSGRAKAKADAVELGTSVGKAKDALKALATNMEAGRAALKARKFPDDLAKKLASANVDFDGTQLAGRRFSGFSTSTTQDLIEFVTAVQGVNDRKLIIQGLLTKLQKPISEQLKIPEGEVRINYVVAVDRDSNGNVAALLSHLAEPIPVAGQAVSLPSEFLFTNGNANTKLGAYKGGDISNKPAAIYVVPKSFDTVCPSASSGQIVQLGAQIGGFVHDINGEGPAEQDTVADSKPGLLERADKLIKELGTVGG